MTEPNEDVSGAETGPPQLSDEEFMRKVADRVWEMLKRDLRIERERAGFLHSARESRGR